MRVATRCTPRLALCFLTACGAAPAAPAPPPPAVTRVAPPPPPEPVAVVNLAASVLSGRGYQTSAPQFTATHGLVFDGPVGLHHLDLVSGVERVLWNANGESSYFSYQSPRFIIASRREPFGVDLVDLDARTVRTLPVTPGTYAMSHDETRLLWQPQKGAATLFDVATLAVLHTFPDSPRTLRSTPKLSNDGRYAYVYGNVYEIANDRVAWDSGDSVRRVSFTTVSEHPAVLVSWPKELDLVELESGQVHAANADCIDPSYGVSSESYGGKGHPWFVRECPRGLLVIDLAALATSKAKIMQPTRIRGGGAHRVTDSGGLAVQLAGDRWVLQEPGAKRPKPFAAPASAAPGPEVLSSSADGTRRIERDVGVCRLVEATQARGLPGQCGFTWLSPDGAYVAQIANRALVVRRTTDLQPIYETDPDHDLDATGVQATLEEGDRIHVVPAYSDDAKPRELWVDRTEGAPLGDRTDAADAGAAAAVPEEDPDDPLDGLQRRRGQIDDVIVREEGSGTGGLQVWTFKTPAATTPQLTLVVGLDFGIFESASHRVHLVGDRNRAARWLRCLEADGVLRPFATCADRVSATLY